MNHSASFLATGSAIAASAWVASVGFLLRTSSMTFSSASASACDVVAVAATAAGVAGRRVGAGAACWGVAGARAGAGAALAATGAVGAAAGWVFFAAVWGTTCREIGRGFGNGTFG